MPSPDIGTHILKLIRLFETLLRKRLAATKGEGRAGDFDRRSYRIAFRKRRIQPSVRQPRFVDPVTADSLRVAQCMGLSKSQIVSRPSFTERPITRSDSQRTVSMV